MAGRNNLNVRKYPKGNGDLYRDDQNIIYKVTPEGEPIAVGYDPGNRELMYPIRSNQEKYLMGVGIKIDDSLARECVFTGRLSASRLQAVERVVNSSWIYQPIDLSKIVFDYIIVNQSEEKFNLKLLPTEINDSINLRLKLSDKRSKLYEMKLKNKTLIEELKNSYLNKIKELESDHFLAIDELRNTNDNTENTMVSEIRELTIEISNSS